MKYLPLLCCITVLVFFANPVIAKSSVKAKSITTTQIAQDSARTANNFLVSANQKCEQSDFQAVLANLNQTISLDPKFAEAYTYRGLLKYKKLNDRPGAINDFRIAAKIYRQLGQSSNLKDTIEQLRKLGATE